MTKLRFILLCLIGLTMWAGFLYAARLALATIGDL